MLRKSHILIGFETRVEQFIHRYNHESHGIYLYPCEDANYESLRLYVANTTMISSNQQVAGAVVSTLGLATPFVMAAANAPFYLWFYYFPHNTSQIVLSLSDDISEMANYHIERGHGSWAFLVRPEQQVINHTRKFDFFLGRVLRELEAEQRKYRRQRTKTNPPKVAP